MMMMMMMLRLTTVLLCLLVLTVSGQNVVEPPKECPPCDCTRADNCIEVDASDPCSCCSKCNRGVGEVCGPDGGGECSSDLLCLPDDPYSANYKGKCYEITPCLTFGCKIEENGECSCYYNNVCPIQRFPYYTKEECQDAIKVQRCKEVTCPSNPNEQECGEGMYYEEGPSFFDHCCPANGRCICNVTLCTSKPEECPQGTELITEKADRQKGKCCDNYSCNKITCSFEGVQYTYGDTWKDGRCTNCSCTNEGVQCTTINCTQLNENCTNTYIQEGQCCPVCSQIVPSLVGPSNVCITEDGMEYSLGQSWKPNPCLSCQCTNNGDIKCNQKLCDEPLCKEGEEEYYLPMGACCPGCKNITSPTNVVIEPSPTPSDIFPDNNRFPSNVDDAMPTNADTTPTDTTPIMPTNAAPTMPTDTMPTDNSNTVIHMDTPTIHTSNLVLLLNVPYKEVRSQWEEFSMELVTQLKERLINVEDVSIRPDTSSAINATIFSLKLIGPVNESLKDATHQSDIATVVNQMVIDYSMTMMPPSTSDETHGSVSGISKDEQQMQLTATIIVLTLLAAITLVSFIGVVIILVIINRRVKTAKTIRGVSTKPRAP